MNANGPAVVVVSVTRRSTGQNPDTPRQRGRESVTVQGGYGVVFAIRVQGLLSVGGFAVQF